MSIPSLSSDELNLLIYKYLLESGFIHTSYTFSHESLIKSIDIAPGMLISLVQKGLQYTDIEYHINEENEIICENPVSIITPHICKIKGKRKLDVLELDKDYPIDIVISNINILKGHISLITTLKYNNYHDTIITTDTTGLVKLWSNNIGRTLPMYKQSLNTVVNNNNNIAYDVKNRSFLSCDINNYYIIAGTYGGILYIWDVPFMGLPRSKTISNSPISMVKLIEKSDISNNTNSNDMKVESTSNDNKSETFILVGTMDGTLYLLSSDGTILSERPLHRGGILDLLYDNSRKEVISAGSDGVLSINSISTKEFKTIQEEDDTRCIKDDGREDVCGME